MSLLHTTPQCSLEQARLIAREQFAIEPQDIRSLPSERDLNFLLRADTGKRYVLKIANRADSEALLSAQTAMMHTVALQLPEAAQVIAAPSGQMLTSVELPTGQHWVRFVEFLEGTPWSEIPYAGPRLLTQLGRRVAQLTQALESFDAPALHRDFLWDLRQAESTIVQRLPLISDGELHQQIDLLLLRVRQYTAPHLSNLPLSIVHHDLNDGNIVVRPQGPGLAPEDIVGFVDFGDALFSWTVSELAIAAAYACLDQTDPLTAIAQIVAGYHEIRELRDDEIASLFGLLCLRLCLSAAIAAEQVALRPGDAYLSISQRAIRATLPRLVQIPFPIATCRLRSACGKRPNPHSVRIAAWLDRHREEWRFPLDLANILSVDSRGRPTPASMRVLDLSVASPLIPSDPSAHTPSELQRRLDRALEQAQAQLGVGRYLEPRAIYTAPQYGSTGDWGAERRTIHLGLDLFAPAGTPVLAPLSGQVVRVANLDRPLDYGGVVLMKHQTDEGDSFYSLYGHLSSASLQQLTVGGNVEAGAPLGCLGTPEENGGWPPHLHLQLIVDHCEQWEEFPGVARASQIDAWKSLCPDPNHLLQLEPHLFPPSSPDLATTLTHRRSRTGGNLSIGYREPLKIVRGWQQWLYDHTGRQYLDAYNNVPHVGHCHPHVTSAITEQLTLLSTNTRYLHDGLWRLAERIAQTLPTAPPDREPLNVCFVLNSASEANELAIRMARTVTGARAMIVQEAAYHGHTTTLIDVSPYKHDGPGGGGTPDWVHKTLLADLYRGPFRDPYTAGQRYASHVGEIVERLHARGEALCGYLAESCPSVGGQIMLPSGYLREVYAIVRAAGGICIADDVQTGYGRLGHWFYGFEQQQVYPDMLVLGKPIGNGHPLAALVTTRTIADAFNNGMEFFSTFGGSTVSCAAGLAVLEVLATTPLQQQAAIVGDYLLEELTKLKSTYPVIGDVRGSGYFLGLELVRNHDTLVPATDEASFLCNRMRDDGVLIGTDGPLHNVLKIRPPLPFDRANADQLLTTLRRALEQTPQ